MLVHYMLVQMKIVILGWGNNQLHLGQMETFESIYDSQFIPKLIHGMMESCNWQYQLEAAEVGESDSW